MRKKTETDKSVDVKSLTFTTSKISCICDMVLIIAIHIITDGTVNHTSNNEVSLITIIVYNYFHYYRETAQRLSINLILDIFHKITLN